MAAPHPERSHSDSPVAARIAGLLAAQISGPMDDALQRVAALARDGRIDRDSLQALAHDIARTRQAGIIGQRIARLAEGLGQQPDEAVDLAELVRTVLRDIGLDAEAAALRIDASRPTPNVAGDAALLHTLVQAAAQWAAAQARTPLQWSLQLESWPSCALLVCSFARSATAHSPAPLSAAGPTAGQEGSERTLDGLLMRYAARVAGVRLHLSQADARVRIELRFDRLINDELEGVSAVELDSLAPTRQSLAGCQLLLLASGRALAQRVRLALQGQDAFVDRVPSVEQAERYCEEGLPQAVLYESDFESPALAALRQRLSRTQPPVAWIELHPHTDSVQHGGSVVRLGLDALDDQLPMLLWLQLQQCASVPQT